MRGPRLVVWLGLFLAAATAVMAEEEALEIRSADQKVVGPLNIGSLNRLTTVALSGTPSKLGGFVYAFDRRLDTAYEAKQAGPVTLDLGFARDQTVHSVRLLFGEQSGRMEWSLAMADGRGDLEGKGTSYREVVASRERLSAGNWEEIRLPSPTPVRVLRLTIRPLDPKETVVIRECNVVGEQRLEAIALRSASSTLSIGRPLPLEVLGYFSGGDLRPISGKAVKWTVLPVLAARIGRDHRLNGVRKGPVQVTVQVDKFVSPPLGLEIVDAD